MKKFGFGRGSRDRRDIRGPRKKHGQKDPENRPQKKSRGSLRSSTNYDEEEAGILPESVLSSKEFRSKVLSSVGLDDDSDEDGGVEDEGQEVDRRRRKGGRKTAPRHKPGERRRRQPSPMREEVDEDEGSAGEVGSLDSDEEGVDLLENEYCEYESFEIGVDGETSVRDRVVGKLFWIAIFAAAAFYILYDDEQLEGEEHDIDVERKEPYSFNGYHDARIPDDDTLFIQDPILAGDDELDFNLERVPDAEEGEAVDGKPLQQVKPAHPETGVIEEDRLWDDLSGYAEVSEPFDPQTQLPVLWHVPKAGGTTLQDLMAHCNGMVVANEIGGLYVSDELQVVELDNGNRYINVDVTQADGIEHAKDLGFGSSGLADVAISSRFHDEVSLFTDSTYRGKCFAMLVGARQNTSVNSQNLLMNCRPNAETSNQTQRFLVLLLEGCHMGAHILRAIQQYEHRGIREVTTLFSRKLDWI